MFELAADFQKIPDLPNVKDEISDLGPVLPVPPSIRPKLVKYRLEVLFWGLRDLKKIQFLPVNHPRVDIECGGHVIQVRDCCRDSGDFHSLVCSEFHDHECQEEPQLPAHGEVSRHGAPGAGGLLSASHHQSSGLQVSFLIQSLKMCLQSFERPLSISRL